MGAQPAATRCGEMIEQVRHRVVRTMCGDQFVARKRRPPIAFAARDKYGLALFVGKPIERSLDGKIGAPLSLASARVRKHVGPPRFARGLFRCDQEHRSTASRACSIAATKLALDLKRP
jgi:hypothetical protein